MCEKDVINELYNGKAIAVLIGDQCFRSVVLCLWSYRHRRGADVYLVEPQFLNLKGDISAINIKSQFQRYFSITLKQKQNDSLSVSPFNKTHSNFATNTRCI